jgi:hypothetical protein
MRSPHTPQHLHGAPPAATVTEFEIRAFQIWCAELDYSVIRQAESLFPNIAFADGRRVRGIALTPKLCLARDGRFYDVTTSPAREVSQANVLMQFSLDGVKRLFAEAVHRADERRKLPNWFLNDTQ